jgi:hypothetical protein
MSPKSRKEAKNMIDDIPDDKFEDLPDTPGTIYKTRDFRLDMQGVSLISFQHSKAALNTLLTFLPV